jgi:hypothetical protein
MNANGTEIHQIVYWHRELPPIEAEAREEHVLEASSRRVRGGFAHRDDLWVSCQSELMGQARTRLEQEVVRLGGRYAHVLSESIDSHHDEATDEAWLKGRFTYMLYA